MQHDDSDLLRRAQIELLHSHDGPAVTTLCRHIGELARRCSRQLQPVDRDDHAQDVTLQVLRLVPSLVIEESMDALVFSVSKRRSIDKLRRYSADRARHVVDGSTIDVDQVSRDASQTPEDVLLSRERARMVQQAVSELTPDNAFVLMRDLEGFTGGEIAAIAHIKEEAVRQRLTRSRQRLRLRLGTTSR